MDPELRTKFNMKLSSLQFIEVHLLNEDLKDVDPGEDPLVPHSYLPAYFMLGKEVIEMGIFKMYREQYLSYCKEYINTTSGEVKELIQSYMQLRRKMSSERYESMSERTKRKDKLERDILFENAKETFKKSDVVFHDKFRDPYLKISLDANSLFEQYTYLLNHLSIQNVDFTVDNIELMGNSVFRYSEMNNLRQKRMELFARAEEHLKLMKTDDKKPTNLLWKVLWKILLYSFYLFLLVMALFLLFYFCGMCIALYFWYIAPLRNAR